MILMHGKLVCHNYVCNALDGSLISEWYCIRTTSPLHTVIKTTKFSTLKLCNATVRHPFTLNLSFPELNYKQNKRKRNILPRGLSQHPCFQYKFWSQRVH